MVEFTVTVSDPNGMHARPAGMIVGCAKKYKSEIKIKNKEKTADAKRLFSVMSLGAKSGEKLLFTISGADEKEAQAALASVCEKV